MYTLSNKHHFLEAIMMYTCTTKECIILTMIQTLRINCKQNTNIKAENGGIVSNKLTIVTKL